MCDSFQLEIILIQPLPQGLSANEFKYNIAIDIKFFKNKQCIFGASYKVLLRLQGASAQGNRSTAVRARCCWHGRTDL